MTKAAASRRAALCALGGVALLGCTSVSSAGREGWRTLAWPEESPRVRMQRIIATRRDLGGSGGLLTWLGGRRDDLLFQRPYGVAWDGDDLLVADPGARRVLRITAGGRIEQTAEGELQEPVGVASCAEGVVVTDARGGTILQFTRDLRRFRALATGLSRPTGVACEGGRIFVTETARHQVLLLEDGSVKRTFGRRGTGPGEFNFPTSVAVARGEVIVGDTLNFRTQRLDLDLSRCLGVFGTLGDAPGEMPRSKGAALDRAGHLWVSDGHLDQVALYETDGTFLMSLGRHGSEPGEFSFPAGIAAHRDGRVAVADSLNRRVQVFELVEGHEVQR